MNMKTPTKEQYSKQVKEASPNSSVLKNCIFAFLFGGFICTIGQLLCNLYMNLGFELKESRTLVSLSLILIAAVLTAVKVYDNIAKHAGAGTLVPITGFANSMVACALEFKSEGFVLGLGAKLFIIAGPVIVFGIISSVIYGAIVFIFKLY